jgi:hypothetical protein
MTASALDRRKRRDAAKQVLGSPPVRSIPAPVRKWFARLLTDGERASGPIPAERNENARRCDPPGAP